MPSDEFRAQKSLSRSKKTNKKVDHEHAAILVETPEDVNCETPRDAAESSMNALSPRTNGKGKQRQEKRIPSGTTARQTDGFSEGSTRGGRGHAELAGPFEGAA
ncbi:hypothetical protein VTL71DRAFT_3573 [Oculimacula yallundae]|uniref:Uncharacterized protein n=1 Tax=Oculimacula yallundae TaxID=86028 RepID=A0ABR4C9Q9_9HELO